MSHAACYVLSRGGKWGREGEELLLETVACVDRIDEAAGEYKVETTGDAS